MRTELFYSHILNINRGSLHTRSFRRVHFSVLILDTDELKMALRDRKVTGLSRNGSLGRINQSALRKKIKINKWNFCSTKRFFSSYILCTLRLFRLKTEGEITEKENHTEKLKLKKKINKIKLIPAKLAELFFELSGPDNYFLNTLTGSE